MLRIRIVTFSNKLPKGERGTFVAMAISQFASLNHSRCYLANWTEMALAGHVAMHMPHS